MMMWIDALFHFYLVIIQIIAQSYNTLTLISDHPYAAIEQQPSYEQFNLVTTYVQAGQTTVLGIQCGIMALLFTLALIVMVVVKRTQEINNKDNSAGFKRILSFLFLSLITYLQIPLLTVTIGAFFVPKGNSAVIQAVTCALAAVNLALINGLFFVLNKLYIPRLPPNLSTRSLHFAASSTQLHSMRVINKIALIVCVMCLTVFTGSTLWYATIPTLLLYAVTGVSRIMLIPHYRPWIEWTIRLKEFLTASLILLLVVAQFAASSQSDPTLVLMVAIPVIPSCIMLIKLLNHLRRAQIWLKLETGQLKLELEHEYAMYLIREKVQGAMLREDVDALSDLLYLAEVHNRGCLNPMCFCHRKDMVQFILNKSFTFDKKALVLEQEEMNLLKMTRGTEYFQIYRTLQGIRPLTTIQNTSSLMAHQGAKSDTAKEAEEGRNGTVIVNTDAMKLKFLNEIAEIYFEDARRKFPYSEVLFYQQISFSMLCFINRFQIENHLRNFARPASQKGSWLNSVSQRFNQLQVVVEIEKLADKSNSGSSSFSLNTSAREAFDVKNSNQWGFHTSRASSSPSSDITNREYSSLERFDPSYFILNSQLSIQFYDEVQHLAFAVQHFWKILQQDVLRVELAKVESANLAHNIQSVYQLYKLIEATTQNEVDGGAGNKAIDYRVCHTFAQMQQYILNDLVQYDLYIGKLHTHREMQRLIKNNVLQSLATGPDDTGFIVANGRNQRFGSVLFCNQHFRKRLGYSAKEVQSVNINEFMPTLVQGWHDEFVQEFNESGGLYTGMLNRISCVFLRKKSGFIVPAMVNVRFHFSQEHDLTFIAFASFMNEFTVLGQGKQRTDDILFMLCDDVDWRIIDVSESFHRRLGVEIVTLHERGLTSASESSTLNVEDICPDLTVDRLRGLVHEQDKSALRRGVSSLNETKQVIVELDLQAMKHGWRNNKAERESQFMRNQFVRCSCQVFEESYGRHQTKIMYVIALIISDSVTSQAQQKISYEQVKSIESTSKEQKTGGLEYLAMESGTQSITFGGSIEGGDGSSMASSSADPTSEASILKQLFQSTEKKSSRNLNLILQLMFVVFILLLALSTLNLVLSLQKYTQLQSEVQVVRLSYDRISISAKIRLLLRGLLITTNGLGPTTVPAIITRYYKFQPELTAQIINLKNTQQQLEEANWVYNDGFLAMLAEKSVSLQYLDQTNTPFTQNETYEIALNLYIQKAGTLYNWPWTRYNGNLSIQEFWPPPTNYTPTEDERMLYFLIKSAQGNMRSVGQAISDRYRSDAVSNAQVVANQAFITIIVSIVSIVLVSLIISPIICRIEEQKYMGLQFFLHVQADQFAVLDQKANDFLKMNFMEEDERESEKKVRLVKAGVKPEGHQFDKGDTSSQASSSIGGSTQLKAGGAHEQFEQDSNRELMGANRGGGDDFDNSLAFGQQIVQLHEIKLQVAAKDHQYSDTSSNSGKAVGASELRNQSQEKIHQISNIVQWQKVKIVVSVLLCSVFVSAYFIAAYFYSVAPFNQTEQILQYLDHIFLRDTNLEIAMVFVRDDLMQNFSIMAVEDETQTGTDYFLSRYQLYEQNYLQLRQNLPPIYSEISWLLEAIELPNQLNLTQLSQVNKTTCYTYYSDIVEQGFSNSLGMVYRQFMKAHMDWLENLRTFPFILTQLRDQNTLQLIDLKHFCIDLVWAQVKNGAQQATTDYYQQLIKSYTLLYGIFILLMVLASCGFIFIGYNRVRDTLWKTHLSLKILPIEYISKDQLPALKAFANY